jgi:hypothetical protein
VLAADHRRPTSRWPRTAAGQTDRIAQPAVLTACLLKAYTEFIASSCQWKHQSTAVAGCSIDAEFRSS